nr:ankyrin repeat [Pandoravirus massiliensis]
MTRKRGKRAASAAAVPLNFADLPNEILADILGYIGCIEATAVLSLVDRRWRALVSFARATGRWACADSCMDRSRLSIAAAAAGHIRCLEYLGTDADMVHTTQPMRPPPTVASMFCAG